ncbi:ankyrin [Thozetella sp. PMI_491]|nr:ankyrin [Thozetella sp. PMI_491]
MAPQISEEEIDDLVYFARAGEKDDLEALLSSLAEREKVSKAELLVLAKDEGKSTCLHMATGNGHLEIVKILVEAFASRPKDERQSFLDAPNEYGNTGLHWAALGGHLDTVKLLVENGASPVLANDKNYVPLDLASFNNHTAVVDYFLAKSESLEGSNAEGLDGAVAGVELEDGQEGEPKTE